MVVTKGLSSLSPMRDLHYDNLDREQRPLRSLSAPLQEMTSTSTSGESLPLSPISEVYTPRATEVRDPLLFFVLSGGEKRERNYLEQLKKQGYRSLRLIFVAPQGKKSGRNKQSHPGSSPRDLKTYWLNVCHGEDEHEVSIDGVSYQINPIDRIFFLTDLDSFRSELQKLLVEDSDAPYRWIISNPCFEMWLYYSYCEDDPTEKLSELIPMDEVARPKRLKSLCGQLRSGGIDPRKAFDLLPDALSRATRYAVDVDAVGIPVLFATQMVELAEQIWQYIEHEVPGRRAENFKNNLSQRTKT